MKINNKKTNLVELPKFELVTVNLNPYFITGLTEAEGCFSITKHKDKRAKNGVNIGLRFKLTMLVNEMDLLQSLKSFFKCGSIRMNKDGVVDFEVRDLESLDSIIVPHFLKYPLRGTKYLDFLVFKDALDLIKAKAHYSLEGLTKLNKISLTMNSLREHKKLYCPDHAIVTNSNYIPINGNYINGFVAGDGCLSLNIKDRGFGRMSLQISQHKYNELLILSIANYFKSPTKVYYHNVNSIQLTLSGAKL